MPIDLPAAIEENLFAFFRHISRWEGLEWRENSERIAALSLVPFPLFNSLLRARTDGAGLASLVAELQSHCREHGVPAMCWTGPSSAPGGIEERLPELGFAPGRFLPGMALALTGRELPVEPVSLVKLETVESELAVGESCAVIAESFGFPEVATVAFEECLGVLGLGPESPLQIINLRLGEDVVSTAAVFVDRGVAGIYNVATHSEYRRRGFGEIVTRQCLHLAALSGAHTVILHASAMGAPVYERLGFVTHCRIGQFMLLPASGQGAAAC